MKNTENTSKKEKYEFKIRYIVFIPTSFYIGIKLGDISSFMIYYVGQIIIWSCLVKMGPIMENLKRREAIELQLARRDIIRVHRRQVKKINQDIRKAKAEVALASNESLASADAKEPSSNLRVSEIKRAKVPKNLGEVLAF